MLFKKKIKASDVEKPILNIADGTLRELIATFLIVFAISAMARLSEVEILSMKKETLYIFNGLFFGAGIFIFNADMNPAITFARWIRGFINFAELTTRWTAQIGAAFAAFYLVKLMGASEVSLNWHVAEGVTAIDLVMIEGFFIAILITVLFSNYKRIYKPLLFAVAFILIQFHAGDMIDAKLNFLFVLVPSIIFNEWTWHVTMFAIAHLSAVSIMVIFWIKDSWTD